MKERIALGGGSLFLEFSDTESGCVPLSLSL
jgi:hypothetical protein